MSLTFPLTNHLPAKIMMHIGRLQLVGLVTGGDCGFSGFCAAVPFWAVVMAGFLLDTFALARQWYDIQFYNEAETSLLACFSASSWYFSL